MVATVATECLFISLDTDKKSLPDAKKTHDKITTYTIRFKSHRVLGFIHNFKVNATQPIEIHGQVKKSERNKK